MAITLFFEKISIKLSENEFIVLGEVGSRNCFDLDGRVAKTIQVINYSLPGITNSILNPEFDYKPLIKEAISECNKRYKSEGSDLSDYFYARNGNGTNITEVGYLKMVRDLPKNFTTYEEIKKVGFELGYFNNERNYINIVDTEDLRKSVIEGKSVICRYGSIKEIKKNRNIKFSNTRYFIHIKHEGNEIGYLARNRNGNRSIVTTNELSSADVIFNKADLTAKLTKLRSRLSPSYVLEAEEI